MKVEQEDDLLAGRALTALGVAVVLIVIGAGFGVSCLVVGRERTLRPSGAFPERLLPRPSEHSAIEQDSFERPSRAKRQHEREAKVLGSYGWTDRGRGLVRIPIDRAIDLYVAEANRR
jgi:hypothetical protein